MLICSLPKRLSKDGRAVLPSLARLTSSVGLGGYGFGGVRSPERLAAQLVARDRNVLTFGLTLSKDRFV